MSQYNGGMDTIEKVLSIVNEAVSTKNYTSMAKNIGDLFKPESSQDLYQSLKNQYAGNRYHAGHMEGRPYSSAPRSTAGPSNPYGVHSAAGSGIRNNDSGVPGSAVQRPPQVQNPYYGTASALSGKLMFGFGIAGVVLFAVPAVLGLWGIIGGGIGRLLGMIPLVFAAGCGVLAVFGSGITKDCQRFVRYKEILGNRMYADTRELAEAVGKTPKAAVRDIRKMIVHGWFRQGHFDTQETTFVATDALYSQYQETVKNAEVLKREQASSEAADAGLSEDVRQILEKGNAYIGHIRKANDAIADEDVSGKLSRMENIVTKIFAQVRKQPSLASNLNMFMDYYLPTTTKLIDAYQEMDSQPIQGENILSGKKEIRDSLDTINDAFEKLLDSFFRDKTMDVSTDISVMKTMFKQDGLTPDDLEQMKKKQASQPSMEKGPTLDELKKEIDRTEKEKAEALRK